MSGAELIAGVKWDAAGLLPVVAQDAQTGQVLMLAWMNREALAQTVERGVAVYWSRSRQELWEKGQTSGQIQRVVELRLDCDGDALLLRVMQTGVACHTGRKSCFFRRWQDAAWVTVEPVVVDPHELYR